MKDLRVSGPARTEWVDLRKLILLCQMVGLMLNILVVFGGQLFRRDLSQCRFQKPAGVFALRAGKAAGFDAGLAVGRKNDVDGFQCPAPI